MSRRRITAHEQQQILTLARQGKLRKEISRETGLSRDAIEYCCRRHGVPLSQSQRGPRKDELRIRAIALLFQFIPDYRELARRLGHSDTAIWDNLTAAKSLPPV